MDFTPEEIGCIRQKNLKRELDVFWPSYDEVNPGSWLCFLVVYLSVQPLSHKVPLRGVKLSDALKILADFLLYSPQFPNYSCGQFLEVVSKAKSDEEIYRAAIELVLKAEDDKFISLDPSPQSEPTAVLGSRANLDYERMTQRTLQIKMLSLIEECDSIFRGVGGFLEKYMDKNTWHPDRSRRHQDVLDCLGGGPKDASQDAVQKWLQDAAGHAASGSTFHLKVSTSQEWISFRNSRLDTFHYRVGPVNAGNLAAMASVGAVGVLRGPQEDDVIEYEFEGLFSYVTSCVYRIFEAQPSRLFVHAFTIDRNNLELWVYDRSGPMSSGEFDISTQEGQEVLATALCFYATMSLDEAGCDSRIIAPNTGEERHIVLNTPAGKAVSVYLGGEVFKELSLFRPITTCYAAKAIGEDSQLVRGVLKFSWLSASNCDREIKFLKRAAGIECAINLNCSGKTISTEHLRQGLKISSVMQWRGDRTAYRRYGYSNRSSERFLVALFVTPYATNLKDLSSPVEFVKVIRDGIAAHRALCDRRILHRGISHRNLMVLRSGGEIRGLLIDLDHACELDYHWKTRTRDVAFAGTYLRASTVIYMAIGIMEYHKHTFRHDVESFWWLLLYLLMRQSRMLFEVSRQGHNTRDPEVIPPELPEARAAIAAIDRELDAWRRGDSESIASHKYRPASGPGLKEILDNFHPQIKLPWIMEVCEDFRALLFGPEPSNPDITTPSDPDGFYERILARLDDAVEVGRL